MDAAFLDTDVLIRFSRSDPGAQDMMRRVGHRLISIVTWAEFLAGTPEPQIKTARAFLDDTFDIVETSRATYEGALELRRTCRLKLPDALIYAGAKEMELPLITYNQKDFDPAWQGIVIPEQ